MLVHVDDMFMPSKTETPKSVKENIKQKFNISDSVKVKKFIGVYNEWGHDEKGTYAKMTMEKGVKKLVEGYEKYMGVELRVQNTPRAPCTTLSKGDLEEPDNINKYRSFIGQLMCYTTKMGLDMARKLAVPMSHLGPEHWNSFGRLIGYLKGK